MSFPVTWPDHLTGSRLRLGKGQPDDGEGEIEVEQAGGHDEEMEQLVGLDDPGPEDRPVQEIEQGPHAVEDSAGDDRQHGPVGEPAGDLEVAEEGPPAHREVIAGGDPGG